MAEIPEIVVTGNKSKNIGVSVLGDLNKIDIPQEINFQAELPEVVVTGNKPKTIGVSVLGDLNKIEVPTDFCCILTLNPSKGKFSGTRQELPESFKNKFISIEFPEMKKEELYGIVECSSRAFEVDNYFKGRKF